MPSRERQCWAMQGTISGAGPLAGAARTRTMAVEEASGGRSGPRCLLTNVRAGFEREWTDKQAQYFVCRVSGTESCRLHEAEQPGPAGHGRRISPLADGPGILGKPGGGVLAHSLYRWARKEVNCRAGPRHSRLFAPARRNGWRPAEWMIMVGTQRRTGHTKQPPSGSGRGRIALA